MIYLNNAATSFPKPQTVIDAVTKTISSVPLSSARTGFDSENEDIESKCRKNLSTLFNIKNSNNLIFTSGATESLSLAIFGLNLKGKHVITTESEHNSVIRPLKTLESNKEITLSFASCNSNGIVNIDSIKNLIQNNTALIVVNHASNVTGNLNDIEKISKICKEKQILFLVDASQSAGIIPINIEKIPIDILVYTGHKSLLGITGIGGIYIKEDLEIEPLKIGGTGIRSDLLFQPKDRPIRYEAGTPNIAGISSLLAGTNFILKTQLSNIYKQEKVILDYLVDKIKTINSIQLYGDYTIEPRCPIVSFNIKGIPPEDVGFILESSYDIIIRSGLHCAPLIHKSLGTYPKGSVRISLSYYTIKEDIDILINALIQISEMN